MLLILQKKTKKERIQKIIKMMMVVILYLKVQTLNIQKKIWMMKRVLEEEWKNKALDKK
jgi:hypothetical protein